MKSNVVQLAPSGLGASPNAPRRPKTDIDILIGMSLRAKRLSRDSTVEQVAAAVGITYQQLCKHEHGENRLTVARLLKISSFLGIDPGGFVNEIAAAIPEKFAPIDDAALGILDQLAMFGSHELLKLYCGLSTKKRAVVLSMIRELSKP